MSLQQEISAILADPKLTHEQQVFQLAKLAENQLPQPPGPSTEAFEALLRDGLVCDMGEGHAPYCPRYILPDYARFFEEGSQFLRLPPPKTLYEALYSLLIFYHNIPSVTHFPVYLGQLDVLLEPFCADLSDEQLCAMLRGFLLQLDRCFGDSFVHANIGPARSRIGEALFSLLPELQNAIPNLTLIYDPEQTPDDFACLAILASLDCANPAFALDSAYRADFGEHPYGIASCYNGLPVGGGAFTLQRVILGPVAERAGSIEEFFQHTLPEVVQTTCHFIESRIRFLMEDTAFFQSSFLVQEGFIHPDHFVGLFGLVGLAECVDILLAKEGKLFGKNPEADALGVRIMDEIDRLVKSFRSAYSPVFGHQFMLHAQVGLCQDSATPGVRIPIGREPALYTHLRQAGLFHKYFPTGVGDIFPFDETAKRNPQAVLDIFKGAFSVGLRYISTYAADSDLIRVTGYLVKKSEVQAVADENRPAINDMSLIASQTFRNGKILERQVRSLD